AVIAAWAVAVRMNGLRFKPIDLNFTLIGILKIPQNPAAESNDLIVESNDLCHDNFIFIKELFSLLEDRWREVLSQFSKIQHRVVPAIIYLTLRFTVFLKPKQPKKSQLKKIPPFSTLVVFKGCLQSEVLSIFR